MSFKNKNRPPEDDLLCARLIYHKIAELARGDAGNLGGARAESRRKACISSMRTIYSTVIRKEKTTIERWSFSFGSGIGIRTPTYRVRVCCATVTQFRYLLNAQLVYHKRIHLSSVFLFFLMNFVKIFLFIKPA